MLVHTIDRQTPASAVLAHPDARAVVRTIAPEAFESPMLVELGEFPVGSLLRLILGEGDPRVDAVLDAVAGFEDLRAVPVSEPPIVPRSDYEEDSVPSGSAASRVPASAIVHVRTEIVLEGPAHGNPFVDVDVTATLTRAGAAPIVIGGFYDGDGVYRLRFLPPSPGRWEFTTSSNARSLHGITGAIDVVAGTEHGPVRAEGQRFTRADGTPFAPMGTTAYAWTHQPRELRQQTLDSLAEAPFNKLRMCLFPKSFLFNHDEPDLFVFPRRADGSWDTERFDVAYFAELEDAVDSLARLGIEADLILFHPYDRWGFAAMGATVDDRYVAYVTRRLSAFANVWWSMANEYDLLTSKRAEDWTRLAGLVRANDAVGHPLSIHNWFEVFDYSAPWATHASLQRGDRAMGAAVARWRRQWGKPVIVDELGYEGDIDQGWGNLTGEELLRRFWEGTLSGGYLTHGETYYSPDEVIFWSKGGTLRGRAVPRLRFLRTLIEESPTGALDPLPGDWDFASGGVAGEYILTYFGDSQPAFRTIHVPDGMRARVDIIDTWSMTVTPLPGVHTGDVRVELPGTPYIAIRLRQDAGPGEDHA
jgi:hypothetical protein